MTPLGAKVHVGVVAFALNVTHTDPNEVERRGDRGERRREERSREERSREEGRRGEKRSRERRREKKRENRRGEQSRAK